jgi:hypothetical protein
MRIGAATGASLEAARGVQTAHKIAILLPGMRFFRIFSGLGQGHNPMNVIAACAKVRNFFAR